MRELRFEEFERNSLTVFAISMIANVLSYLYQIVMGNMLTPADYGMVNTMGGGLLVLAANLIYIALTPEKEKAAV